jgi:hypothetical protein
VQFSATGIAGAAAELSIVTQPSSTANHDEVLAQQPVVRVRDAHGNPKAGVSVTVSLGGGGGLQGDALTVVTNADGLAAFSGLKITDVAGSSGTRNLIFSTDGVADAVSDDIAFTAPPAESPGGLGALAGVLTPRRTAYRIVAIPHPVWARERAPNGP